MALVDYWPLFGLRVRTPRIELRYPDDDLLGELVALSLAGIHDPETMPFGLPWTDTPAEELPRASLQHHWTNRATWNRNDWNCPFVTIVDGKVVGTQALFAKQFPVVRVFETGSWLGRAHQGQGIGKEMRAAILHFGFAGLDAREAVTGAWHDNHASAGVTKALGYVENGEAWMRRRDEADRMLRFRMPRDLWETQRRDDIEIEGLEPCLELFGAA